MCCHRQMKSNVCQKEKLLFLNKQNVPRKAAHCVIIQFCVIIQILRYQVRVIAYNDMAAISWSLV